MSITDKIILYTIVLISVLITPVKASNIIIQDINEKYGLPKNRVNCVAEDSKGFLWFGMANGLYKFDLNTFTKFTLSDNNFQGFPELEVKSIVEVQPGILMIGTNKGLYTFQSDIEAYDTVVCGNSFKFNNIQVQSICHDQENSFWIGTDRGLVHIRSKFNKKLEFDLLGYYSSQNSSLNSYTILDVIMASDKTIWYLTTADLGYYDSGSDQLINFEAYGPNSSILYSNNQIIDCRYGDGLLIFNTIKKSFESPKLNNQLRESKIRFGFKDKMGKYWFSISNVGLLLVDSINQEKNLQLISNKNDSYANLNSNVVYRIFESSDGAIWICTEEGINMITIQPELFNNVTIQSVTNSEVSMGVRSIVNSEKGFIWIGTVGGGLFQYDQHTQKLSEISVSKNGEEIGHLVQAMIKDKDGNLWMGTEGEGLIKLAYHSNYKLKPEIINYRLYPKPFPANTISNDYIMCLLQDKNKNLWIGTWYGLSLLRNSEMKKADQSEARIENYSHDNNSEFSLSDNTIMSMLDDREGNLWIGTLAGINKIVQTKSGFQFENNFKNKKGIPLNNKKILDMCQDINGNIWFSTQDGGICLLNSSSGIFEEFNSDNGFHDHIVNSIAQDSLGILWLGTNNGLCRFDPGNHLFNMYHTEDGLLSNDFFYKSMCKVENKLYYGGNKGFTFFDASDIVPSKIEPRLTLTNFLLFNENVPVNTKKSPLQKHISSMKEISLGYNNNYVTFEFAALNYRHQKEIQYSCILEGLESTWNNLKQDRKISYTSLKPGHYVFKVRAYTSGQNSNTTEIKLPVTVKPPFWKTTIAYLVYVILIAFSIYYGYWFFLKEEKRKHALTIERINAKKIHEMDMMKLQFYTNISHELRTPLTLITAPLESLVNNNVDQEKTKSYYELMLKNVMRLRRLINQLLDMRKIEEGHLKVEWSMGDVIDFVKKVYINFETYAEKRKINYVFETSVSQLNTFFDTDKLEKVIYNLLSNAFKYTPDNGSVSIKIESVVMENEDDFKYPNGYFLINIIDTGFGIPEESLANIFKPFHQVKKNKPIGSAGTGIGLSLTIELVVLLKGEIIVKSEINKGSVFTVKLPVNPEIPFDEHEENLLADNEDLMLSAAESQSESKSPLSKPLLLIVENDKELRNFIGDELSKNYRILKSNNGKEGLKTAIESIPDLVVSDIMMDEMDGIELCQHLKEDMHTSHIPVILLTARHSEEIKQNGFEIGADDFITKPFNINLLQARIKNLIEQRRNLRKLFGAGSFIDFSENVSNKTDFKFIEKLNGIIEINIDNLEFNPVTLASEMAMSKMQLYRKVSALTNQTVYNYIRTQRMNKAAQLLITSDLQITEVAYNVGFSEASNFTKTFYKHFSLTPTQFIKEHKS